MNDFEDPEERRAWMRATIASHSELYDLRGGEGDLKALGALLTHAAHQLRGLHTSPAAIASCPDCFNDAATSPNWRSVCVGDFRWCNDRYFEPAENQLGLRSGPAAAGSAFDILEGLERADWRGVCGLALGRSLYRGEVSALVCLESETLFAIAESNGGDGAAYRLGPGGEVIFLGVCDRIDSRLRHAAPIIRWVGRDEWATQAAASGNYFYRWEGE